MLGSLDYWDMDETPYDAYEPFSTLAGQEFYMATGKVRSNKVYMYTDISEEHAHTVGRTGDLVFLKNNDILYSLRSEEYIW